MLKTSMFLIAALFGGVANAQVAAQQMAAPEPMPSNYYGSVEVRHHLNTYFDDEGYRGEQEPSTHVRLQLGVQLYNKNLDLYATVGVYKQPQTQQILQRRPEIAMDLHLLRTPTFQLMQYNIVQVPFDERQQLSESDKDGTDAGSVYTVGLAPTVSYTIVAANTKFKFKSGLDGWTKMYTRKKYVEDEEDVIGGRRGDGYGIVGKEGEPLEDTANHYDLLSLAGVEIEPGIIGGFSLEPTINYTRKFKPQYEIDEVNNVDYKYLVEDRSYYRVRAKLKLSESLSLINDFYHFHGGFFESKRDGENRRFRNIARITCKL